MALFRIFYLNQKTVKEGSGTADMWRRCQKTLPRSHPVYNLYEYRVPEQIFRYSQGMGAVFFHNLISEICLKQLPTLTNLKNLYGQSLFSSIVIF